MYVGEAGLLGGDEDHARAVRAVSCPSLSGKEDPRGHSDMQHIQRPRLMVMLHYIHTFIIIGLIYQSIYYIHTYIHTYVQHSYYILIHRNTYIHTYIHTYIQT